MSGDFGNVPVGASGGVLLWSAGNGTAVLYNQDSANTVYLNDTAAVTPGTVTSAPLPSLSAIVVDGSTDVYGQCLTNQTANVGVVPGGINFFNLAEIITRTIVSIGGTGGLFVYDALNHLIASAAAAIDTDPLDKVNVQGIASYAPGTPGNYAQLFNAALFLNSVASVISGSVEGGPGNVIIGSGTTGAADTAATVAVTSSNASAKGSKQIVMGTGPSPLGSTASLLEVQGQLAYSGSNSAGSAPQPAIAFTNGTAGQMPDLTRDFMVYFQVGTSGTGFSVKIGPNNPPTRTVYASATPPAGGLVSFRVPAGFFVEWAGTGTTLTSQTCIGC